MTRASDARESLVLGGWSSLSAASSGRHPRPCARANLGETPALAPPHPHRHPFVLLHFHHTDNQPFSPSHVCFFIRYTVDIQSVCFADIRQIQTIRG